MNIEELKLILEAMSGLGAGAKEMFIWWLVFDKAIPAVLWFLGIVAFSAGMLAIFRMVSGENQAASLVKKYRARFNLGGGYLCDSEVRGVERRLDELLAGEKK